MQIPSLSRPLAIALTLIGIVGCAAMATQRLAGNLSQAILNQDDPATVRAGAPAYLLLLDALIEGAPNDPQLLMAGARLYAAYGTVFVEDEQRAQRLTDKAHSYARRALCVTHAEVCARERGPFQDFAPLLASMGPADLPALYTYAMAWAAAIGAHRDEWTAVANVPKVEAVLERVIALDARFERGQPQLYLALLRAQRPAALGGRPDQARALFEQAIALSHDRNLMAKVELARTYARMTFDKTLHDRLLREVLEADPHEPSLTLSNALAQEQARELLASSESYFQD